MTSHPPGARTTPVRRTALAAALLALTGLLAGCASSSAATPSQAGRTVVVTGAISGLGLVTARELARAGTKIVQWMFTPVSA